MLFLTPHELIAIRDPRGFRPLALGRPRRRVGSRFWDVRFDLIDAKYVRDVEPGEMIVINEGLARPIRCQRESIRCASSSTSICPT
jgi:amidophosphoribosyltransferase